MAPLPPPTQPSTHGTTSRSSCRAGGATRVMLMEACGPVEPPLSGGSWLGGALRGAGEGVYTTCSNAAVHILPKTKPLEVARLLPDAGDFISDLVPSVAHRNV